MTDRAVRKTGKDLHSNITSLCDDGASWSPRLSADAIRDIESGLPTYDVPWTSGRTESESSDASPGSTYVPTETTPRATTWTTCPSPEHAAMTLVASGQWWSRLSTSTHRLPKGRVTSAGGGRSPRRAPRQYRAG